MNDDSPIENSNEDVVCVAYINDDGEVLHINDPENSDKGVHSAEADYTQISKALSTKFASGSRQSREEIGTGALSSGFSEDEIVTPPYPPQCLANFLEVDTTFFRAAKAKALDSVGREIIFKSTLQTAPEGEDSDYKIVNGIPVGTISNDEYQSDHAKILSFMQTCNETIGFHGVLERAAMDFEGIGWAAIEVIRNRKGEIKYLEHVPAQRLRVLKGFKGFVEITSETSGPSNSYVHYQVFGRKFVIRDADGSIIPFNPYQHKQSQLTPNFIDFKTGDPTSDFDRSANEILYIPKHHSNTIYYGYSDILPAVGAMVANVYIRDYINQFFEHNTVPRYAVFVKGAKIDDEFTKKITAYFHDHIKGQAHKTLVLAIPNSGVKQVEIEFKALDVMQKEADFLTTRKENSNLIMVAMGTSPAILGIAESSELGSGKGLSQAEIYKDRVVTPCQKYWAEKLNLLFSKGLGVKFAKVEFDPLDIRDMMLEMQYYTGLQAAGDLSINEVRKATSSGDPIKGGDTHYVRIKDGSAYRVQDLPDIRPPVAEPAATNQTPAPAANDDDDEGSTRSE